MTDVHLLFSNILLTKQIITELFPNSRLSDMKGFEAIDCYLWEF